jgi:hypothetical protein
MARERNQKDGNPINEEAIHAKYQNDGNIGNQIPGAMRNDAIAEPG